MAKDKPNNPPPKPVVKPPNPIKEGLGNAKLPPLKNPPPPPPKKSN
jgi:hypothetical protein